MGPEELKTVPVWKRKRMLMSEAAGNGMAELFVTSSKVEAGRWKLSQPEE
jgi:hypothetical protein